MKKHIPTILIFGIILSVMIIMIVRTINKQIVFGDIDDFDSYEQMEETPETILICIKGEVKNPGIYEIDKGSILNDLVALAGGFTNNAGKDINLVYELNENLTIYIKSEEESGGMDITDDTDAIYQSDDEKVLFENKVDINTSDIQTLCLLPGIGEKTAEEIIRYRESIGIFETIEDIMNVSGIKTAKFEKIKDYITIGNYH
jgi:competence protein ComEA